MQGTLRHGSGLLDVPVASVLPHLMMTVTYSGFRATVPMTLDVDGSGDAVEKGDPLEEWFSDGAIAVGLLDRVEIGATLQRFANVHEGGRMLGAFGRLSLLPGSMRNVDLAVGTRYVSAPTYSFSPYVVATALLPGFEAGPEYEMTVTAGWGGGMFGAGRDLDSDSGSASGGIFVGSAIHFAIGQGRLLNLMADYNGLDANAGAQLDFGGIRVGAFSLGPAGDGDSTHRSRRFGVLGSVALCGADVGLCRPSRRSAARDTVVLPAPPPDTVVVERRIAPEFPAGAAETLCLGTGVEAAVAVTVAGDTLVGPSRVSLADLRPGIVFAGTYAQGRDWFVQGSPITLGEGSYARSGDPVRLDCGGIVEIGSHEGVPLFADRSAQPPFEIVYVPVRPGVWQGYSGPGTGAEGRPSMLSSSGVRSSEVSMSDSTSR